MATTALERARSLELPTRGATLQRHPSVARFWTRNRALLVDAWHEWERDQAAALPRLDEGLIDAPLRHAVDAAWDDPTTEARVRALWEPVAPGVFQCQLFDRARLQDLHDYLHAAARAGVPTRPPYGIVLNRHGAMLDGRSSGYLAPPAFQDLYRRVVRRFMRPISRLLFPEVVGFDTQSFGFSIVYTPGLDTSIRPHTDASATTLNVNLNLPEQGFAGSGVDFYGPRGGPPTRFRFEPGVAVLHRGSVAHAAQPITQGARRNLVLWLYGEQGRTPPRGGASDPRHDAHARWADPLSPPDAYAPF